MRPTTFVLMLTILALVLAEEAPKPGVTGALGNAAIVKDNPIGVRYTATLPNSNTTTIRGSISATASGNGTGVQFTVDFSGFPDQSLGPFLYHIHDQPVPANESCKGTLAHLDPSQRGDHPACDSTQPETCQVGDLAGKHGNIAASPFTTQYVDFYVSTKAGIGAFLGNRSIVIHSFNTTRLTCANFLLVSSSSDDGTATATTATASRTSIASSNSDSATATPIGPSANKPTATSHSAGAARDTTGISSGSLLALIGGLVGAAMLVL
ncbi:MAG: hypothetical protein M1826_003493 [Phylliscum demangeonii]|nr:MAG: hypothetical protein M1826_003493 [Phylliscum demangeonii]